LKNKKINSLNFKELMIELYDLQGDVARLINGICFNF
jgi:hypothetical protein